MLQIYKKVPSRLSTVMITFDAGARAEVEEKKYSYGIAHMLEHMIFKGTEKRDCFSIPREIALLGGKTNAFTSNEMVSYYITVPFENIEKAMEILSDITFNSLLLEEEFLKEREVVLEEEAEACSDTGKFLWRRFSKDFFSGRLQHPVIGYEETIKNFSIDELSSFYKDFYLKNNAIVSLSSCIEEEAAEKMLEKYFGKNSGKITHSVSDVKNTKYKESSKIIDSRMEIEHSYIWMGYPGRYYGSPNEAADSIMLSILGSGMDSRLFEVIRERNGLCYGINAGAVTFRDQGAVLISSSTREENIEKLISLVREEIDKIQTELVSDDELLRSKNQFRAQTYALSESSKSTVSWETNRSFYGLSGITEMAENVNNLTKEDILNSAKNYFDRDKELIMIVNPGK